MSTKDLFGNFDKNFYPNKVENGIVEYVTVS